MILKTNENVNKYFTVEQMSPLGRIYMASDGNNLTGLWIENQKYFASSFLKEAVKKEDLPIFEDTKRWLDRYFAGKKPQISELNLAPSGGEFRQEVWSILCSIPYGEIITYGEIAEKVAVKMNKEKMSAQAVGGAVGHNPISIIIPCHRVIGKNGNLTGYAGGIHLKIKLLEHEGVDMSSLFVPQYQ
ncbi:MAG: methylated-DNA--[protein]-cysteine S-methyltransferase [Lachnospiraceae bacterium]|nr:methylated-DNA--[protein]-cysteine S-methyltransferase [Lachnospiraceae bacterium]